MRFWNIASFFFRDQDITPGQQLDFAHHWGDIHEHLFMPSLDGHPGALPLIKHEDETAAIGNKWHTDQMYTPAPAMGTMLYAKEVPAAGGDTMFSNAQAAYEAPSDGMKNILSRIRTLNRYSSEKQTGRDMKPSYERNAPGTVEHPLIRTHPESGRKSIYLSHKTLTRGFAGMTAEESTGLHDYLLDHISKPEFTCRFRWAPGSLAFWDNRSALHYAINDYHGQKRVMHRVTIKGEHVE